jgi:hypothetical protein
MDVPTSTVNVGAENQLLESLSCWLVELPSETGGGFYFVADS